MPDKVVATELEPAEPAVYGGDVVAECAWPSVVSMQGSCTGTLVHPEYVIYAAHCGQNYSSVTFGQQVQGGAFTVPTEYCKYHHPVGNGNLGSGEDVAFCKLATPVTNVPIVPILMGCETDALAPGAEIVAVGFGQADNGPYGVKREVTVNVSSVDVEVVGGGNGQGVCSGDSGGPAFIRLPSEYGGDDTWRVWGVASWAQMPQQGVCNGVSGWGMMHRNMEWFETETGVDLTPCHDADGTWAPGPGCTGHPLDPGASGLGTWSSGCVEGPTIGDSEICGPPVASEDPDPPTVAITAPATGSTFMSTDGIYQLEVTADANDVGWGIDYVELYINGQPFSGGQDTAGPYSWTLNMPPGGYSFEALAVDIGGNQTWSEPVQVGIDQDAPPPPDDGNDESTGGETGAGEEGGVESGGEAGGEAGEVGTGSGGNQDDGGSADSEGCACDVDGDGNPAGGLLMLGLLGLARRRR